jgi:hypothetical protein
VKVPEKEGEWAIKEPDLEFVAYTHPIKALKVNIGTIETPKIALIGDYWSDETVENIAIILDLEPPTSVTNLRETMCHRGYYRNFIKGYVHITEPIEKLLNKEATFQWNEECHKGLDTLKKNLVTTLILIFQYWNKEFHAHVNASSIVLGIVLYQPGEGDIDHPIYFVGRKLSIAEKNNTTIEREELEMVYAL